MLCVASGELGVLEQLPSPNNKNRAAIQKRRDSACNKTKTHTAGIAPFHVCRVGFSFGLLAYYPNSKQSLPRIPLLRRTRYRGLATDETMVISQSHPEIFDTMKTVPGIENSTDKRELGRHYYQLFAAAILG